VFKEETNLNKCLSGEACMVASLWTWN